MIDFTLMNKALKSIWIKRCHLSENLAWTVIPNETTLHLGGLNFLSTCNCNSKDLNIKKLPLFYERMLQYWFDFKDVQNNKMPHTKKTIIWNNQDIKIDNKTIVFRTWFDKVVYTLRDLLDPNLYFYTYEEFNLRSTMKILHGIIDNDRLCKLTNHLLLIAKYYIYCSSINEEPLYFSINLTVVINKAEIEKQISTRTNSTECYYNKWKPLIDRKFVT